ncbi:MAG: hypothetical protein KAI72_06955 [Candidatus Pacebacteria bacterium]|nr:hypothetical protein [Candidatus Paceibacterota bacterium]
MRSKIFLISVLGLILFMQRCSTLKKSTKGAAKGAKEGFKEDWEAIQEVDGWMREHLW